MMAALKAAVEEGLERVVEIVRDVAPDAHVEMQYEYLQSGYEDD